MIDSARVRAVSSLGYEAFERKPTEQSRRLDSASPGSQSLYDRLLTRQALRTAPPLLELELRLLSVLLDLGFVAARPLELPVMNWSEETLSPYCICLKVVSAGCPGCPCELANAPPRRAARAASLDDERPRPASGCDGSLQGRVGC